jgi:uncharacterized RDD family membrane protein YckC
VICSQRRLRRHIARLGRIIVGVAGRRCRRPTAEIHPLGSPKRSNTLITSLLLRRTVAFGLDCAILFVLLAPITFAVHRWLNPGAAAGPELYRALLLGFSLPAWSYFVLSDCSRRGATLGKHLMHIRVRTLKGSRPSLLRAITRSAAKLAPWELAHLSAFALSSDAARLAPVQIVGLTFANFLWLSYFVAAILSRGCRSLHDYLASTVVRYARWPSLDVDPEQGAA